jgi:hypothetical protein
MFVLVRASCPPLHVGVGERGEAAPVIVVVGPGACGARVRISEYVTGMADSDGG